MTQAQTQTAAPEPSSPSSPSALAALHNPRWQNARHTQMVDQALVYLEGRRAPAGWLRRLESTWTVPEELADDAWLPFTRLLILEPPRHGKSEQVSRYFPAWYVGRHPTHHVILTSYGHEYAATWGRRARDVLDRVGWSAFGVLVSRKKRAANEWELEGYDGGMYTAGIGGAITGRGANVLAFDDLVKGAKDASSVVMQEAAWDWWLSEALSRLEIDEDGLEPIVVGVATRWHEADVPGRIIANEEGTEEGEVWWVLRLPAIAEANDPLGREPGEALWPERRPLSFLERVKRTAGSYWWSALYQQRPTPLEGNVFQRSAWQWYDQAPEGTYPGGIFVDTAGYDTSVPGDYWAFASVIRVQKDLYWLNAEHGRWSFSQAMDKLRDERANTGLPIYIERTSLAIPLIQEMQRQMEGVVAIELKGLSKETRALSAQPNHEAGNFYLPTRKRWTSDFVDEHAAFPNAAHDDWVDTTSMANRRLYRLAAAAAKPAAQRPRRDVRRHTEPGLGI